ncbi:MAG: SPOR domain-containing protein [Halanaerobium sp.]
MNKNENGFSLVIVVIFMSIAALFVGYLMGSWLISFLVEDDSAEIAEQEQNTPNISQQLENNEEPPDPEEVNNSENNLTAPTEEELDIAADQNEQDSNEGTANPNQDQSGQPEETEDSSENTEIADGFGVQIGAFSNYNNALSLRDKIEEMGYEVVATESSPHQVLVTGYSSREEAESAVEELEEEGYTGFIVIRE